MDDSSFNDTWHDGESIGWCLAKHTDGRAGWLPVDYVEQVTHLYVIDSPC